MFEGEPLFSYSGMLLIEISVIMLINIQNLGSALSSNLSTDNNVNWEYKEQTGN